MNNKVLTQNKSNTFDFPNTGYVSGLLVHENSTNLIDLYNYDTKLNIQRSKIRVIGNGNAEIINAEARHLAAMQFYETGNMPHLGLTDAIGGVHSFDELIQFGRYLGDPEYGLILDKFSAGVEFEETNTFSPTYYTSGSDGLTVWALMRKNPESGLFGKGYFKKRQIMNKDAASETQYPVKLPTNNKLKQIHVFSDSDFSSHLRQTSAFGCTSVIWLGVKGREEYLLDNITTTQLSRLMADHFGLIAMTKGRAFNTASSEDYFETCIYDMRESVLTNQHASVYIVKEDGNSWLDSVCGVLSYNTSGSAVGVDAMIQSRGLALFGEVPLLMTDPIFDGEDQYLDAQAEADVYVEFTEGNSTGNTYIVLDELEKVYPR